MGKPSAAGRNAQTHPRLGPVAELLPLYCFILSAFSMHGPACGPWFHMSVQLCDGNNSCKISPISLVMV